MSKDLDVLNARKERAEQRKSKTSTDLEVLRSRRERAQAFLKEHYHAEGASLSPKFAWQFNLATTDLDLLEHAWQIYTGALRTTISGAQDWPNLQIVAVPSPVLWDDTQFGPYYFNKDTADFINDVGGSYKKTAKSFSLRYGQFLNDVMRNVIDKDALSKAQDALKKADTASSQEFDLVQSIKLEWQQYDNRQTSGLPPSQWISMEDWYDQNRRNEVISASNAIVVAYWGEYLHWIQLAFGGQETLYTMLDAFHNFKKVEVAEPRTDSKRPAGKTFIYPYYVSPDYPDWLTNARAGNHVRLNFRIKHDSYSYDYSRTSIGAGIGIGLGFFGLLAGGQRQSVSIDTTQSGFELYFEADLGTFSINPSADWYDSSAFDLFRKGPFFAGSPMDNREKMGALFGPQGFLSFRPARAVVAYKPVVAVKLSYHEYHYFRQVTEGAVGFFVGPFLVGVGGYYDVKESVRWDDQNLTLNLYNGPETPHLLAFDSEQI